MTTTTLTTSASYPLNEWGGPVLPDLPAPFSFQIRITRFLLKYVVFSVCWPLVLLSFGRSLPWADLKDLYEVVSYAEKDPIDAAETYQDRDLLRQVYQLESAQPYLQNGVLEWQPREGFCAWATLRCVIKSFGISLQEQLLPYLPKTGANDPEHVCEALENINRNSPDEEKIHLDSRLYRLDNSAGSYEHFLQELESNLKDPDTRVAVNYLRPALFGWPMPWYWWPIAPSGFILGLFGGHFSPLLGMIRPTNINKDGGGQQEPLVAIFDVNHMYGGTYLVPARRLYNAVKAKDISTKLSRALVFVTDKRSNR